uniref:Uncharacterized protein n=1 Tax=Magallana gigas TaxID=29159 RepID=A0A8W8LJH2_MAGGI
MGLDDLWVITRGSIRGTGLSLETCEICPDKALCLYHMYRAVSLQPTQAAARFYKVPRSDRSRIRISCSWVCVVLHWRPVTRYRILIITQAHISRHIATHTISPSHVRGTGTHAWSGSPASAWRVRNP